jgi:hypothetical protein
MKVSCPQCGAENQLETPDDFVVCAFCHASLYIDLEAVTAVFTFAPQIESERVALYLKADFDKFGLGVAVAIRQVTPVYVPFWGDDRGGPLRRACSRFAVERIPLPSATSLFFERRDDPQAPLRLPVDLQPPDGRRPVLFIVPFYEVLVSHRERTHTFFVNAVSGGVAGRPLPRPDDRAARRRFPLFIGFFLAMLAVNYLFDHIAVAVLSNLLVLILFSLADELWPAGNSGRP